jgi:hypothetical protein
VEAEVEELKSEATWAKEKRAGGCGREAGKKGRRKSGKAGMEGKERRK